MRGLTIIVFCFFVLAGMCLCLAVEAFIDKRGVYINAPLERFSMVLLSSLMCLLLVSVISLTTRKTPYTLNASHATE
jgi:hypothetical protein